MVREVCALGADVEVARSLPLPGDPDLLDTLTVFGDRGRDTASELAACLEVRMCGRVLVVATRASAAGLTAVSSWPVGKSLPRVMLVASSRGPGGPVVPGSSLSASRSSAGAVAGSDSGSCVAGALEEEVGSLLVSPSVSVFDCDTAGSVSGTGSRPGS